MDDNTSRRQIVKSTGIVGGSQVITIIIGLVRTKVLAVLLGPVGVGIAGLYQTTVDTIKIAANLGINFSAVRNISQAAASSDVKDLSRSIKILRQLLWFTGILGMLAALIFCKPLSRYTFGDEKHAFGIAILSFTILTASLSSGQLAVLQGLRRITQMAKASIFSALAGTFIAIPIYWWLGIEGIVPTILLTAIVTLGISWFFARAVKTYPVQVNVKEIYQEGFGMVKLGIFTVLTNFINLFVLYWVRAYIVKKTGLDSVGQFVAAWTISSMYLSAILGGMASDFYPRLSTLANEPQAMNKLVNEQTEIAVLVASPIIVGMISFIDVVIEILYSKKFNVAAGILSWQLVGDFFKILSWPIGYTFIARAKGKLFGFTNAFWSLTYLLTVYFGWQFLGLEITGIAFLIAYLLTLVLGLYMSNSGTKFVWSGTVIKYILVFTLLLTAAFLCSNYLSQPYRSIVGSVLTLSAVFFSIYHLKSIVDLKTVLKKIKAKV